MKEIEIKEIIFDRALINATDLILITKKLYKLHLQSQIDLLETVIEHPQKPGYRRHDVLDKIKELKKQLKQL